MVNKPKVLIIDDDAITRMLVLDVLSKNGFDVIEAENGRQGIDLFASHSPDLVLLDVIMPEMDGFECLRLLCGELQSQVPIVMMTAVEDIHCIELAYQLGATDFIGKPIQWLLLPYRVRFVLRNHQMNLQLLMQQSQLQQSSEELRLSLSAAKQDLWEINVPIRYITLNAEYNLMYGFSRHEYVGISLENWFKSVHPDDRVAVETSFDSYLSGNCQEFRVELRLRSVDGSWKWILSLGSVAERDAEGRPLRMIGTHTDINDSKIAQENLQLMAKVFENSGEAIFICDAETRILSSNAAFTKITGYAADEVLDKPPNIFSSQHHDLEYYQTLWQAIKENGYWQGEIWDIRKNGKTYPISLGVSTILSKQGDITHYIGIFSDITERKANEARIEYLAHHDPLTNLPNRLLINSRFDNAIANALYHDSIVAVLFLDLDKFKQINDTFGHNVGDRLLQGVAERLSHCVRQLDTVCRHGGDEFIIILDNIPDPQIITRIAQKILDALRQPFIIETIVLSTSFSIGISQFPADGTSFDSLLAKADSAMYTAKKEGRDTYRYFSPALDQEPRQPKTNE